ncbi:MAG: hypothetical protein JWP12_341 [Bacteroidetes bacterium]|nr:hypothetical protein [Bacteroidota bacterium]
MPELDCFATRWYVTPTSFDSFVFFCGSKRGGAHVGIHKIFMFAGLLWSC